MKILAIDPGNEESAYCLIDTETYKPLSFGKIENKTLRFGMYNADYDLLVIEMIASYRYGRRTDSVWNLCVGR